MQFQNDQKHHKTRRLLRRLYWQTQNNLLIDQKLPHLLHLAHRHYHHRLHQFRGPYNRRHRHHRHIELVFLK
jgi:hypothetical protein